MDSNGGVAIKSRVLRVADLGLRETASWKAEVEPFEEWIIVSVLDSICNDCATRLLIIVDFAKSSSDFEPQFLCVGCCKIVDLPSLTLKQQHVFIDRYALMKDVGLDLISIGFANLIAMFGGVSASQLENSKLKNQKSPNRNHKRAIAEESEILRRGEDDAPIPKGFRSVSWIRVYEAHAVKFSHDNQKDHTIRNSEGQVVLECKYFENDSFEVRKFKANVQAVRVNGENRRVIGWIRPEEARAVILAEKEQRDVDFSHIRAGKGGMVQYFPEHLEVARKYRSTTRLLRRD